MIPTREEWLSALAQRHGPDRQKCFSAATVAVCGLGGLGSCISIALARAGIGRLILTDFDRVDLTNLHRQQYKITQIGMPKPEALAENLREINPYIELELYNTRITEENAVSLLQPADVICEAFDRPEAKAMLTNLVLEQFPQTYLVAASGMAGFGDPNCIQTRRITEHFYLCGDGRSDIADGTGLVSARVMVCAAHQAHTVLRILSHETDGKKEQK